MKKYIESNGDLASLVMELHKMGNRQKRKSGDEPYFDKALERFLDAKRPAIAYQYYKDLIIIENENIIDGQFPIISYTAFNKRIKVLLPCPIAVARHGKFTADQWFAYCGAHKPPTRILERVEIDHTPLDLILLDDELLIPLGKPYLTFLVDAKAISHAIKPKNLEHLSIKLQSDWPCHEKIVNVW